MVPALERCTVYVETGEPGYMRSQEKTAQARILQELEGVWGQTH